MLVIFVGGKQQTTTNSNNKKLFALQNNVCVEISLQYACMCANYNFAGLVMFYTCDIMASDGVEGS